ncbi:hypothetical protein DBV15_09344 [Temnothorax longispinosus]|uniref:Uncharacterized protein n=1 Tax=Temnothorax longispinosus TaxID=300112 RepID=A0A4V3SC94_9HYME|nr:hypothetical protein DBV15_09344 [Temnothorax longispinosus]
MVDINQNSSHKILGGTCCPTTTMISGRPTFYNVEEVYSTTGKFPTGCRSAEAPQQEIMAKSNTAVPHGSEQSEQQKNDIIVYNMHMNIDYSMKQRNRAKAFQHGAAQPSNFRRSLSRATADLGPSILTIVRQAGKFPRNNATSSDVATSKFLITRNPGSLSTRDRTPALAHLQFLGHATRRFVTEQFKLVACTIPPAGSKLGRPIKIPDSRVVANLMALDNDCLYRYDVYSCHRIESSMAQHSTCESVAAHF